MQGSKSYKDQYKRRKRLYAKTPNRPGARRPYIPRRYRQYWANKEDDANIDNNDDLD